MPKRRSQHTEKSKQYITKYNTYVVLIPPYSKKKKKKLCIGQQQILVLIFCGVFYLGCFSSFCFGFFFPRLHSTARINEKRVYVRYMLCVFFVEFYYTYNIYYSYPHNKFQRFFFLVFFFLSNFLFSLFFVGKFLSEGNHFTMYIIYHQKPQLSIAEEDDDRN